MPGMRMNVRLGKMAIDEAQSGTHLSLDFFHNRVGLSTVGAFVVSVLHQGHLCRCRPLYMIALAHRHRESWHLRSLGLWNPLQLLKSGKHTLDTCVYTCRVHVTPANDAFGIDHEERVCAGSLVGSIDAIGSGNRSLWLKIREQREPQLPLLSKCQVGPHSIDRNTEQFRLD